MYSNAAQLSQQQRFAAEGVFVCFVLSLAPLQGAGILQQTSSSRAEERGWLVLRSGCFSSVHECVFVCVSKRVSYPPTPHPDLFQPLPDCQRCLFSWKSGSIQFSLPGEMTSSSYSLTPHTPPALPILQTPPPLFLALLFTRVSFLVPVLSHIFLSAPVVSFGWPETSSERGKDRKQTVVAGCGQRKRTDVQMYRAGVQPALQHSGGLRMSEAQNKSNKGSSCMHAEPHWARPISAKCSHTWPGKLGLGLINHLSM